MALGPLESEAAAGTNSGEETRGQRHPAGAPRHSSPSPVSAFHCSVTNSLGREGQEGEKEVTISFLPLLNNHSSFDFPHPLHLLSSIFFSSNPAQIVPLPPGPQPQLWLLSTCPLRVSAKGSKLSYPHCQGFWTGMSSKQLTYKRTFVTQPALYNMETTFIKKINSPSKDED